PSTRRDITPRSSRAADHFAGAALLLDDLARDDPQAGAPREGLEVERPAAAGPERTDPPRERVGLRDELPRERRAARREAGADDEPARLDDPPHLGERADHVV